MADQENRRTQIDLSRVSVDYADPKSSAGYDALKNSVVRRPVQGASRPLPQLGVSVQTSEPRFLASSELVDFKDEDPRAVAARVAVRDAGLEGTLFIAGK